MLMPDPAPFSVCLFHRRLDGVPHDFAFVENPEPNFPTAGLVFAGLMSLMDPPRRGVPEAVTKCKQVGRGRKTHPHYTLM